MPTPITDIPNTNVATVFAPLIVAIKHTPIPAINMAINKAISTKILSYQLSFISSLFALLPTPTTIIGTNIIIRIIKIGISTRDCLETEENVSYKILLNAISSAYSKLSNTAVYIV